MNFFNSFRSRIAIILSIIVLVLSSIFFYAYNRVIEEKFYQESRENIKASLSLVQEQYIYSIKKNNGKILYSILEELEAKPAVLNTYLVNSEGQVVFPRQSNLTIDSLINDMQQPSENEVVIKDRKSGKGKFFRSYIRFKNSMSCIKCHTKNKDNLGYIVLDFVGAKTNHNLAVTRIFSIAFTILMIILFGTTITFIQQKYLKKSLQHFKDSIEKINSGNLNKRVQVSDLKELKELGYQFNSMLDNFQNTRKELLHYHNLELKNSKKLASIGEMAARLAHEIRNPMTGIANAIEIIVEELPENQDKSILEEVKRQAERVNAVISNLLAFSASKELDIKESDLNELIDSLVFFLNNQKHEKEIRISADLESSLPFFRFDKERLENVLLNLGLNAIQSIEKKGFVLFTTRFKPEENKAIISVTDNGIGISTENYSNIFSPFYTTKTEGTGLGLAIVKDIIDKHDGEIWVEKAKPKGTTFFISLPIEADFFHKN